MVTTIAMFMRILAASALVLLIVVPRAEALRFCEQETPPDEIICAAIDPPLSEQTDLIAERLARYARIGAQHRLSGLASYYSTSLDGSLTANGETYRHRRYTAAHLTLPLGCWVEVSARATGRRIRLRVNDRGPYVKKFCLDLSQAAARALGVDVAEDRHVDIRIIALPGESPLD
ncbi:MAG: septal ring lytic transglycosylase RlpA family protein [Thermoanaerobaculia bacterium]